LLPALALMRRDRARNELGHEDVEFIVEATRETTEDLPAPSRDSSPARQPGERTQDPAPTTVVLRPARDEADAVALHMLGDLLRAAEIAVETLSARSSLPDALDLVAPRHPDVVCIGTVVPGGITQIRHFCRSIRTRVPGVTLVVGVWGDPEVARTHAAALRESGADRVAASLIEARDFIVQRLGEHGAPGNSDVVVPDRVSPMTSVG
jgi:hypothetical protein